MKKPKPRKPVRYRPVTLKLTARQKRSLDNYCRKRNTTPIKVIKQSIRPYLENFTAPCPPKVAVNQLTLFE